ncbi:MAG: phosphoenolpyruvate carboxykinase (GTP) [Phycisphaerae bacterium]
MNEVRDHSNRLDKIITNTHLRIWIQQMAAMCEPDRIVLCQGGLAERRDLFAMGVSQGVFIPLNHEKLPACYLHRSNPNDVARSEASTYICTPLQSMAGPTNNWMDAKTAYTRLQELFNYCMRGRTMYVLPFVMGPIGSRLSRVGVELTDSLYVAASMDIMTRMGERALRVLGDSAEFARCLHSIGDCDPHRRYICHFPLDNAVWSFGSGYGGNALLGKKCMGLRLASFQGFQQGWMAEHMLISGIREPDGHKSYVTAAFPSACGKTNFAMLIPPESYQEKGWQVTTVGDDIAWMWVDDAGRLRAINPETGYFGVLPGTSETTNPIAMRTISHDTIYTNVALLPDGDVWWEGKTARPPASAAASVIDWQGNPWTPECERPAAHPNSRFTSPMENNPILDPAVDDPNGVPVTAIIFGGRRASTIPIVYQAFNWSYGVYVGASLGSETTAAATGRVGVVRRDPMAMLPFIGYNIGDYLVHWFRMRSKMADPPRIYHVNWFRRDEQGKFIWPGFRENIRILEWILNRSHGRAYAVETLLGWMPRSDDINLDGLKLDTEAFAAAQRVDAEALKAELLAEEELFLKLAGELPKEMIFMRELLISRL